MIFALRCIGIEPCFERGEEDNLRILMKTTCCTRLSTKSFSKTRSLNNDALHRHCLLENSRRLAPFFSLSRSFSRQTTLVGRSIHVYVTVGHPLSVDPSLYLFSRYTLTAPLFPAIFYSGRLTFTSSSWPIRGQIYVRRYNDTNDRPRVPGARNRRPFAPPWQYLCVLANISSGDIDYVRQ